MLKKPIAIYDNWTAYDELSDQIELTEDLATRQLDELLLRLEGKVYWINEEPHLGKV
jgi:hypothetical protein